MVNIIENIMAIILAVIACAAGITLIVAYSLLLADPVMDMINTIISVTQWIYIHI